MTRTTIFPRNAGLIGFDHLSDMIDRITTNAAPDYPPYNIEKLSDDAYRVVVALAGFSTEEISIETEGDKLRILANKTPEDAQEITYLHKGIANRGFKREFHLAPHMVVGDASLANGLLSIDITRVIPDTMKPRQITIQTA